METVEGVEHWRKKAFDLSSSDRIGFVASRAMDLMAIVVKDGTSAKNLQFAARSLEMEKRLTMEEDADKDVPLRNIIYGLCEMLGATIKAILDEKKQMEIKMERILEVKAEQITSAAVQEEGSSMLLDEGMIKEEEIADEEALSPPIRDTYNPESVDSSLILPKDAYEDEEEDDDDKAMTQRQKEHNKWKMEVQASMDDMRMDLALTPSTSASSALLQQRLIAATGMAIKKEKEKMGMETPRPHECNLCGKKFTTKKSLENHALTHSGLRAHICELCGWEFVRRNDLLRHLKNVDHSKPVKNLKDRRKFECDYCGVSFYRSADKSNHIKKCHVFE